MDADPPKSVVNDHICPSTLDTVTPRLNRFLRQQVFSQGMFTPCGLRSRCQLSRAHALRRWNTHREIFYDICSTKPNLYCNYTLPIDLTPHGNPFGAKSMGKVQLQSKFELIS